MNHRLIYVFISHRTDIQDDTSNMFGNITLADNLWQNPFDIWKDRPNPTIPAASELQMGNKAAFDPLDLRQAILDFTEKVRQTMNSSYAEQTPKQPTANRTEPAATKIADNDSSAPAVYDNGQTNKNDAVVPASLHERIKPLQFFDDIDIQNNPNHPVYAIKEEFPPQTHSIYSHLAAMGAPSLSLTTGSASYQPTSHPVNLSNSSAIPLTAYASNPVQGSTNSNANRSSAKDYGYGNRDIYPEKSSDIDEIRKAVENIVISIAEEARDDLVGLADTILDVVLTVWKFGRITNLVLGTASLVIGVCYVATQTQKKWETEKVRVLAKYDPKDEAGRKKLWQRE